MAAGKLQREGTGNPRVAAVAASSWHSPKLLALAAVLATAVALADESAPRSTLPTELSPFEASQILETPAYRLELVRTRLTAYEQKGSGYQSQAGSRSGPGSETLHVLQTQAELQVSQGPNISHRLWVPVDIVTSASLNASDRYYAEPDIISTASAQTFGAEAEYQISVRSDADSTWSGTVAGHQGETISSYRVALGYERELANDNATLQVSGGQVLDWFPEFELGGNRRGRTSRSSSNLNLQASQLLSAWTVAHAGYGFTHQQGELASTWNSVPTWDGERVRENLPRKRERHAVSFGVSQWLPWQAALHLSHRAYLDSWQARAHSTETRLFQQLGPWLVLGVSYRYHTQQGVRYFTTNLGRASRYHTADSDLAGFFAQTVGFSLTLDLPAGPLGELFLELGYDHYFRSNHLTVNVATWASGFRF